MAAIAKQCFLLFVLTLLFSLQIHARDSQFFNKVPSNNGEKESPVVVPNNEETAKNKQEQEEDPNFVPENEAGGYGLYGHETGQFPPTTTNDETHGTTANHPYNGESGESYPKYLPKNYNTESYVTEPEGYRGEFDNNKNSNFYNSDNTYYNNNNNEPQGFGGETKLSGKSYNTDPNNNGNFYNNNNNGNSNSYYNGEQQGMSETRFNRNSYYNSEPQGLSDTRFSNNNKNNYYNHNVGNVDGVQKQGMSDTRFLEHGKYFYDAGVDPNFNRVPRESTNNNRGFYGNPDNSYEFNNDQNQSFQDDEDLP